jgi:hypothetical protein
MASKVNARDRVGLLLWRDEAGIYISVQKGAADGKALVQVDIF